MNWIGLLCQKHVDVDDVVLDLGCGKGVPTRGLRCKQLVGVDVFRHWLVIYDGEKLLSDVKHLPFKPQCFDVVLALDVLEHLKQVEATQLLNSMENVARKKIIVYTPKKFNLQDDLGNPYNQHETFISPKLLKNEGYKVSFPKNTFAIKNLQQENVPKWRWWK